MPEATLGHAVATNPWAQSLCVYPWVLGPGGCPSVRAALISSQTATLADNVSSASKDPKVSLAQCDRVITDDELHASSSQLNQHVTKALDQKMAADDRLNRAFIEQAQQVMLDTKKAEEDKAKKEAQPLDPCLIKLTLETAGRKVTAAMKEHIANRKAAADFAGAEVDTLLGSMAVPDVGLKESLRKHRLAVTAARGHAILCLKTLLRRWLHSLRRMRRMGRRSQKG